MFNKKWLMMIIMIIFAFTSNITGLSQYKYTEQSGTGYFVSEADHADALENQNELRMILDELGLLLEHSKYGDASYPADENTTPGTLDVFDDYLQNITSESIGDLSDVDTTGVADNKILKYDIATSKWIIADDEDTGTTYTAGTGLDLTGTVFSLDASAFDLSDFPADPNDDRYLVWNDTTGAITWAEGSGSGVTTFVGLTDTPLAYTGYAGYFPKVNAGATALEFAELTESDISDFGTYLTDITSESILDLSDTPVAFSSGKFLKSGAAAVTFESITESDISDLGSYLENVVEDTTPQAGGDFVMDDHNITGIGRASFTQELDNGSKTTNFTIDFSTDQKQKVTLTANTMTLTLDTTSVGVANYLLKIVDGGLATLTWAAETGSVYWPGGTEPTLTSSGTDIEHFILTERTGIVWLD